MQFSDPTSVDAFGNFYVVDDFLPGFCIGPLNLTEKNRYGGYNF
jgi:hypothetical protein